MKRIITILLLAIHFISYSQTTQYFSGGQRIESSLVDLNVGDAGKEVNRVFHFNNNRIQHIFVKVMNIEGKAYAQAITERIQLSYDTKEEAQLFRKVQNLTNIKIEDQDFNSEQLKAKFAFVKEKGERYDADNPPPLKLMICSSKASSVTCRINDDDAPIEPDGIYPATALIRLGYEDLKNKSLKDLNIMKNEIYARYGYNFSKKEEANYFFKQNWYEPVADNKDIELNDLEKDNFAMITTFENQLKFTSLDNSNYDIALGIGASSSTLFNNGSKKLKSVKVMEKAGKERKCLITEYNTLGLLTSQRDCKSRTPLLANNFNKNFLIEHLTENDVTYYYYNENGLPLKTVKVNYEDHTTYENLFTYDNKNNITKTVVYKGNDLDHFINYKYDDRNNLVAMLTHDKEEKEIDKQKYFYNSTSNSTPNTETEEGQATYSNYSQIARNILHLKNDQEGCEYSYNYTKDIITNSKCFILNPDNTKKYTTVKEVAILNDTRDNFNNLISYSVIITDSEYNTHSKDSKTTSLTDITYYD